MSDLTSRQVSLHCGFTPCFDVMLSLIYLAQIKGESDCTDRMRVLVDQLASNQGKLSAFEGEPGVADKGPLKLGPFE